MLVLFDRLMDRSTYNTPNQASDYQLDCVLHGLRLELGNNVEESIPGWWMSKDIRNKYPNHFKQMWGKGFTVYGLLPEYDPQDAGVINTQIKDKKYDKVIIGIHHTYNNRYTEWLDKINLYLSHGYTKEQIIVIDGWDRVDVCREAIDKTTYYKREHDGTHQALPISFAIPEEKIFKKEWVVSKNMDFAPMIPAMFCWDNCPHIDSYKYTEEEPYYQQYRDSYFAYTCKKAGWDCMRHYEILANGCVPWFTDIEKCPINTMVNFPKKQCVRAKKSRGLYPGTTVPYHPQEETYLGDTRLIKPGKHRGFICDDFDYKEYNDLREELLDYTRTYLTTRTLARSIL